MFGSMRKWHTSTNILRRGVQLLISYSRTDCIIASLFPFAVILALVGMIIYQTMDEGKTQHLIEIKTSEPHFRLTADYFEHMHTPIAFEESSNPQYGTTALYQHYSWSNDDYSIYANSEHNVNLTAASGYSANATLRYHPQAVPGQDQNSGIVLCHQPINANDLPSITLSWTNNAQANHPQVCQIGWTLKPNTTLTVRFQLYINMKGAGTLGREWEGNTLEIGNIEESSYPTRIPNSDNDQDECYGIRVLQNRMVYETLDGFDLTNFFTWFASTAGSVYTFMLGMFVCFASLCNRVCSKRRVEIEVHRDDETV